jgi:hypothetical protein
MTQKYTLRAMAQNYQNGHSWDHLDGESVTKAADEIESLQSQLDETMILLLQAQHVIRMFQGRM